MMMTDESWMMMKDHPKTKTTLAALATLAALTLCSTSALAKGGKTYASGNLGLGLGVGTLASGLSGKYMTGDSALQFNIGLHINDYGRYGDAIALGGDYLFEMNRLLDKGDFEIGWNLGPGVGLTFSDSGFWAASASFVLGLEFVINVIPVDIVLEYRPSLYVFNSRYDYWYRGNDGFGLDLVNFGAHIRFFF